MDDKTELLRSWFDQIESQVQFGDNKAALLVAGDALLLGACVELIKAASGCPPKEIAAACVVPSIPFGLAATAAGLLLVSLACALFAARPARIHAQPPPEFFLLSYVASIDGPAFAQRFKDASFDRLVDEALTAIHGKAAYATVKFLWLRRAVNATLLSVGFMVAAVIAGIVSWMVS